MYVETLHDATVRMAITISMNSEWSTGSGSFIGIKSSAYLPSQVTISVETGNVQRRHIVDSLYRIMM